jgi:uncharacterized protein YdeI (BOF family)
MKSVKNNQIQRATKILLTGAILAAPFLTVLPNAEAQIFRGPGQGWNNSQMVTHTGVVTRDLAGDYFELRTDSNRTIRVNVGRNEEPRRLGRGDRVRVSGQTWNGVFYARNIQFLRDNNNNNNSSLSTFTGVIHRNLVGDKFEMRADNGRFHILKVSRDDSRRLNRGDRVRVLGRLTSTGIEVRDIQRIGSGTTNPIVTTLTGTVTRDLSGDNFELRVDNGRTVRVTLDRGRVPRSLNRGDRVRVTGTYTGDRFVARDLDILRDTRR